MSNSGTVQRTNLLLWKIYFKWPYQEAIPTLKHNLVFFLPPNSLQRVISRNKFYLTHFIMSFKLLAGITMYFNGSHSKSAHMKHLKRFKLSGIPWKLWAVTHFLFQGKLVGLYVFIVEQIKKRVWFCLTVNF